MKYLFLVVVALYIHHGKAYKAAVVAYSPILRNTAEKTIKENLKNYRHQIESLKGQGVDIMVFPEYGLTTAFIYPERYAFELRNDTYVISELRALSRENNMYIVVNLFEKVRETNKEIKYYNTNLVFDREGHIIAKYRKINLFEEPALTAGNKVVTFETDFGVKFGIFTCYDILFYTPSRSILEDGTVTDIIFPTAWTSSIPFFTSLSVQHGYATANGVNLLAASYIDLDSAFDGSGIYLANGKISKIYLCLFPKDNYLCDNDNLICVFHTSACVTKSLIALVPESDRTQRDAACSSPVISHKLPTPSDTIDITWYNQWKMFDASGYTFKDIDLSKEIVSSTVCHKKFCCTFNITIAQPVNPNEYYKFVVYDGKIDDEEDKFLARARICSLVACENNSKDSCGAALYGTTNFTKIIVDSLLDKDKTTFYVPVTLDSNLRPIEDTAYCESSSSNQVHVQLSTTGFQKSVLSFGILGITDAASSVTPIKLFFLLILSHFIMLAREEPQQ